MDPILQALIAAASSFTVVSMAFLVAALFCRRRRFSKVSSPFASQGKVEEDEEQMSFALDASLPQISLSDLAAATKNFSPDRIVGDGGFGFVYKAIFPSGAPVAVKRLSRDLACFQGFREFRAEMDTLARIRHPNLARLLGYCAAGPDRLLIYEYLPGGSLDQRLHDSDDLGRPPLPWPDRLAILRGVASGLSFLHHECRPSIVHRDIKSSNILLDARLAARIADFGLARSFQSSRSHVSTIEAAAGTPGYMAPEYGDGATAITAMGDVYSFGALVVEVVTGRRPSWAVRRQGGEEEIGVVKWARGELKGGREMGTLDPALSAIGGAAEAQVKAILGVAFSCTEERPRSRPSMPEVLALLDAI